MKLLLTLLSISITMLLANPLPNIKHTFSKDEQVTLLKEFKQHSEKLYTKDSYALKKGWNKLTTPKDGVDVVKTFEKNDKLTYITTYENIGKYWAIYSTDSNYPKKTLFLKYLEPNTTFFVLAKEDVKVDIRSKTINDACLKLIKKTMFETLLDSGKTKEFTISQDKTISISSRYYSHNEKGLYDDTRVLLIYPKIKTKGKATYRYGPASPKINIKFSKEYENKFFFTYDFKKQKCQRGIFPSPKMPPFPILQEVK